MDDQSAIGIGGVIGTPLRYIFDHPMFVLRRPDALPPGWLNRAIEAWQRSGRAVYLIGDAARERLSVDAVSLTRTTTWLFETAVLQPTYTDFPDQIMPVRYDLHVYLIHR